MRISHTHKFIFLAMPRTGSLTTRKVLEGHYDIESTHISEVTDEFPFYHHISALELKNIFEERGWDWSGYKKFCTVRNPYDRIVSLFHQQSTELAKRNKAALSADPEAREIPAPVFRDFVMRLDPQKRLSTSLEAFICDEAGEPLVEDILIFEKLNTDIPNYFRKLGIPVTAEDIPVLNLSRNRDNYRKYYDADTRKRVGELYSYEISRFGYSFE